MEDLKDFPIKAIKLHMNQNKKNMTEKNTIEERLGEVCIIEKNNICGPIKVNPYISKAVQNNDGNDKKAIAI